MRKTESGGVKKRPPVLGQMPGINFAESLRRASCLLVAREVNGEGLKIAYKFYDPGDSALLGVRGA